MQLKEELDSFYAKHGFGETPGRRKPLTVPVYTGCMLVPLPNIETRHKYLKYHDMHHMLTGYSVGRIGEGEVSAWELGTGSLLASPLLAIMNLIALSTGLFLKPRRIWKAFVQGTHSRNLYSRTTRQKIEAGQWHSIAQLRAHTLNVKPANAFVLAARSVEFAGYALVALLIHAGIAIPALIARMVTDIGLGYNFFQVIKPKKRNDLY